MTSGPNLKSIGHRGKKTRASEKTNFLGGAREPFLYILIRKLRYSQNFHQSASACGITVCWGVRGADSRRFRGEINNNNNNNNNN